MNAKLLGSGQDLKTTSSYIIDRPWKLQENVPLKFYRTKEGKDIFETYNLFRKNYTSQGLLRKDVQGQLISQVVCTDTNTYVVYSDGKLFASGANDKWQCTELEAMAKDTSGCIEAKYFELSEAERKKLEQEKARAQGDSHEDGKVSDLLLN